MKGIKVLLLTVAVVMVSLAASAQTSVIFTNNDGTFVYNNSSTELTLGAETFGTSTFGAAGELTAISGLSGFGISDNSATFPGCSPTCLGSITLTTGTLATGTILTSATFNPGGNFMVSYTNGVSFSGSFSSASWTQIATNTWVFSGTVMGGTLTVGGNTYTIMTAATVQLTTVGAAPGIHTNKGAITFSDSGGTTNFSVAPEPGTLALFGSGLIVVGMLTRRRLTAKPVVSQDSLP
jgi:hypothetical protein